MTNSPVYQIIMSTDGRHKVTVTIEDPDDSDTALASALGIYAKLKKAAKVQPVPVSAEEPPECEVHHIPMVRVAGRKGSFWSCHRKNPNGSWCTYKPEG